MTPEITFVLVHYRTPERLREAVVDAHTELERSCEQYRIVVVDNSGDLGGDLEGERCLVLRPGTNLGYAGAANLALRRVSRGTDGARHLVLSNPDVAMRPGCIEQLLRHCPEGGAAGPALFWEQELRLQLPPTEVLEVAFSTRLLARFSLPQAALHHRQQWRRHARRHWRARDPVRTRNLSGALLLFQLAALERVGPFDENFKLYFEETDWLRRAQSLGVGTVLVPTAVAVHEYNQSARLEPDAEHWFAQSEELFRRRYRLPSLPQLGSLDGAEGLVRWPGEIAVPKGCRELWFEVSPSATGIPAAAERIDRASLDRTTNGGRLAWQPPDAVAARAERCWLTVSDRDGREIGCFRL